HVAAVEDLRVGAVRAPAAVLRAPALVAALHGGADVGHHALPLLGMQQPVPPGDVGAHLVLAVAEESLDPLVPPHRVAHEVPVPHRVVGGAGHELEALLALAQRAHQPLRGARASCSSAKSWALRMASAAWAARRIRIAS